MSSTRMTPEEAEALLAYYSRLYANQEYLTPGAGETVALVEDAVRREGLRRVLELASGKGEAACEVVASTGCHVVCADRYVRFLDYARQKVARRGLAGNVDFLLADGKALPVAGASMDGAYCIGAPSIVGLPECVQELRRVVRPGGTVVVSDAVWREQPGPLGTEWGWLAEMEERPSVKDYRDLLEEAGLRVEHVRVHEAAAWDKYHAPMLRSASEAEAAGDLAFAERARGDVQLERRAVEAFLDYATFVARA